MNPRTTARPPAPDFLLPSAGGAAWSGTTNHARLPRASKPSDASRSPATAVYLAPHERTLLVDLARDGVLTSAQIRRRYYPGRALKTVLNRLGELAQGGYVRRQRWGFDPENGRRELAGWLVTEHGLRRIGLAVPAARRRRSVLASLPHDATVADLRDMVTASLTASGVVVRWTTERELTWGVPWLPAGMASPSKRPDGVLHLDDERLIAIEVETTQHNATRLAEKVAAYRDAIAGGIYAAVWYFAISGGTTEAIRRAINDHGDTSRMDVRPLPPGVTIYR